MQPALVAKFPSVAVSGRWWRWIAGRLAPTVRAADNVPLDTDMPPEIIDAARRLLDREIARADRPNGVSAAATRACEDLVGCLANFVGQAGAGALYDRSLTLCTRDQPWLAAAATPKGEPPWDRLRLCLQANDAAALAASVALVSTLLELFSTFVGSDLALRIVHQHRPDVFPSDPPEEAP